MIVSLDLYVKQGIASHNSVVEWITALDYCAEGRQFDPISRLKNSICRPSSKRAAKGEIWAYAVPKHDTLDSNSHSTDGHKATGTFTFFYKSHSFRRHNDSTTESMIINGFTKNKKKCIKK